MANVVKANIANALNSLTGYLGLGSQIVHVASGTEQTTTVSEEIELLKTQQGGDIEDIERQIADLAKQDIEVFSPNAQLPDLGAFNADTGVYTITATNINTAVQSMLQEMYNSVQQGGIGVFKVLFVNKPPLIGAMLATGSSAYSLVLMLDGVNYIYTITNPTDNPTYTVRATKFGHLVANEELVNAVSSLSTAISAKQNKLTFDNSPTANSSNPVKSGGIKTALDDKVDKVSGKGLSTNDYTTAEKEKLAALPTNANLTTTLAAKADLVDGKLPASQLPSYVDDVVLVTTKAVTISDTSYDVVAQLEADDGGTKADPYTYPSKPMEKGKIYVRQSDNKVFRFNGLHNEANGGYYFFDDAATTALDTNKNVVEISASLALGETASTAYAGNKGKQNADDIADLKEADTAIINRLVVLEENPTVTFSISPSTVYAGEAQSVTPNVKYVTKSNLNATTIGWAMSADSGSNIGQASNAKTYTTASSQTWSAGPTTLPLAGRVTTTINGISWAKATTANLNVVRPIFYGFGYSQNISTVFGNNIVISNAFFGYTKAPASTNPKTTYSDSTMNVTGVCPWICIPKERDTLNVEKFTMGGAPVAMAKAQEGVAWASGDAVNKTSTYAIYRTTASYDAGAEGITLNVKAE